MKTTKIIITCDLCGKEIAENEAATFTLPTGVTYDFCLDCAKRIVLLASKEIADVPVDEPTADEPKVFIPQGEAPQELIPTPPPRRVFSTEPFSARSARRYERS